MCPENPERASADGDFYFIDHLRCQDDCHFGSTLWTWRESCGDPHKTADYRAGRIPEVWGEFEVDYTDNSVIPAFTDGRIYKYEPAADKFTGYDLPTGASDSVYAVAVDPIDDTVWGCGSNSDTMLHFDPETEEFTTYRFPSLVTFCREISFDQEGNVWTSYSNVPFSSIEGGATAIAKLSIQR
jgi:hypothetical protein